MTTTDSLAYSDLSSLERLHQGKVRDIYAVDDNRLLIVATDRLSAYDVILPDPIPGKGRILNRVSCFWFRHTDNLAANHLLDDDPADLVAPGEREQVRDRAVVVRRLETLPVEAIVRGYLAGSGWQAYARSGEIQGHTLPAGLRNADALPEPLYTPTTKAAVGDHDEPMTYAETEVLLGAQRANEVRRAALALYASAAQHARACGLIIADTKLEFGIDPEGHLILLDEIFTPDSSRFWPADAVEPGANPPSFDKQYIRDYLDESGWDRVSEPPRLPEAVIQKTVEKYREAERRLTGRDPEAER